MIEITLNRSQALVGNAVSDEETKKALQWVSVGNGIIEATDGIVLVRKKINYNGEPFFISPKIAKQKQQEVAYREISENVISDGTVLIPILRNNDYPNTEIAFPKTNPYFSATFSVEKLKKLLKCLSGKQIKFTFYDKSFIAKIDTDAEEIGLLAGIKGGD